MEGKTKSGFVFDVDDGVLDSYGLLKAMRMIDKGRADYMIDALELILGEEGAAELESFVAKRDGEVTSTAMGEEFSGLVQAIAALKNSTTSPGR